MEKLHWLLLLVAATGALPPREARVVRAVLVLEVYEAGTIERFGEEPSHWEPSRGGLFGDGPHVVLRESAWHGDARATTRRWPPGSRRPMG